MRAYTCVFFRVACFFYLESFNGREFLGRWPTHDRAIVGQIRHTAYTGSSGIPHEFSP